MWIPTNNVVPSDGHVTLAWGRDYGDVSPLRGLVLGGGAHTLKVGAVDLEPLARQQDCHSGPEAKRDCLCAARALAQSRAILRV
jgi:hypothetical protein